MKWLYSENPTPRQRANRMIARRRWERAKKSFWREVDMLVPFGIGLLFIGLITLYFLLSV
tara:strand:+ start:365 stop:544 length:180 start_codon:yes stop_codon:yes gene_type:complete